MFSASALARIIVRRSATTILALSPVMLRISSNSFTKISWSLKIWWLWSIVRGGACLSSWMTAVLRCPWRSADPFRRMRLCGVAVEVDDIDELSDDCEIMLATESLSPNAGTGPVLTSSVMLLMLVSLCWRDRRCKGVMDSFCC